MAEFLFSPMILCFVFGVLGQTLGSELREIKSLGPILSSYLLLAIGFKGGTELQGAHITEVLGSSALLLGFATSLSLALYVLLRRFLRCNFQESIVIVMHYGSVSAVTFLAALTFAELNSLPTNPSLMIQLGMLEVWGVVVGLCLFYFLAKQETKTKKESLASVLKKVILTEGPFLLIVGIGSGYLAEKNGHEQVSYFFKAPFTGALCLFLLITGAKMAESIKSLRKRDFPLALLAIIYPLTVGSTMSFLFARMGFQPGDSMCFAVMLASASYIAAPAVAQQNFPRLRLSLPLGMALGITFPFNILIGVPLYEKIAVHFATNQ